MGGKIRQRMKNGGYTMLELTVVLLVIGLIMAGIARQVKIYAGEQKLTAYAEQLKTLGNAANAYASRYFNEISTAKPIPCSTCVGGQVATNEQPTMEELQNLGFLPPGFLACPIFRTPCGAGNNFEVRVRQANSSLQVVAYDPQAVPDVTSNKSASADAQTVLAQMGFLGGIVQEVAPGKFTYVRKNQNNIPDTIANTVFNNKIPPVNSVGYWANYDSQAWSAYLRRDGSDTMLGSLKMGGNDIEGAKGISATANITTTEGGIAVGKNITPSAGDIKAGNSVTAVDTVQAGNTLMAGAGGVNSKGHITTTEGGIAAGVPATKGDIKAGNSITAGDTVQAGNTVMAGAGGVSSQGNIRSTNGGIAAGTSVAVSAGEIKAAGAVEGKELSSTLGRLKLPPQGATPGAPCQSSETNIITTSVNQETLMCDGSVWRSTKDLQYFTVDVSVEPGSTGKIVQVADSSWKVCAVAGLSAYGGDPDSGKANEPVMIYQNTSNKNWYVEISRVLWNNKTRITCFK
ncbi:Type II secretory pathway, pseudopilin PulG [Noviherbaspirillum humi]|uniref:Type II secretory pathway, pseudopilin PulG n=1 Tax=Noviherbaspirillum humi TaxID=1688639 RepID=A0A239CBU2_9BURK|nr:type II secretion system GspH family protein [Noviherbaspirillum humi]SNS17697.1 Type II secretory pathway, pseudopilin PulG [Noviherbaspirillum humi]